MLAEAGTLSPLSLSLHPRQRKMLIHLEVITQELGIRAWALYQFPRSRETIWWLVIDLEDDEWLC